MRTKERIELRRRRHSVATSLPCLSLRLRSLNKWICDSLTLIQMLAYARTSHTPKTLSEIAGDGLKIKKEVREWQK